MIYSEIIQLSATNKILLEVLDGRSVRLTITADSVNTVYTGQKITAIVINQKKFVDTVEQNKVYVKIGQEMQIYRIVDIKCINQKKGVYQLNTAVRSKTSYFITPLVMDSKETMRWNQYFVNCYLLDIDSVPQLGIVYRFFNTEDYKQFELSLRKHPMFVRALEPDYQYTMFIFNFKTADFDDIEKFLKGKYSALSVTAKRRILTFHKATEDSEIGHILYKSPVRRKQFELDFGVEIKEELELYDKPLLEVECWNPPVQEELAI
jgi:hypothetical protein